MIKNNKLKLILSSILILLPALLGVFGKNLLPEEIATHWGLDGNADGFMSSSLFFFVLPVILLALHWLCLILTAVLDKNGKQTKKVTGLIFWIIPVVSLTSCGITFSTALGYTSNIFAFVLLTIAVALIFIGNYLPKTTRNVAIGIKIKWTLANDENWSATHRFAGKVYVATGFFCLLAIPLPSTVFPWIAFGIILMVALLPILYSYRFYKKQLADGRATKEDYKEGYGELVKNKKAAMIVTVILITLLAIFLPLVMFTGSLETTLDDTSITVKASVWSDLTLKYEDIDSVEYRESGVDGNRINGFSSAKLLLGLFENEEFGTYTRYTYTKVAPCIVLTVDEHMYVIGAENDSELRRIYEKILVEISKDIPAEVDT